MIGVSQENSKTYVLPPFDEIANRGISPRIQKYIEDKLRSEESLQLIPFSITALDDIPYQRIFQKKYCTKIIEKINPDFIILSKLDNVTTTGNMNKNKWNFEVKILDI